ncbi:MAG TPA: DNA methyltransferase [Candidatus Saccharimonadales bacterium]|nr:DNA methyltransferase [Candidatus Saccharimonadales bacterium]
MSHDSLLQNQKLKIEEVPVDQLKELTGNPRTWTDKSTEDLTESIRRFGIVDPLVVNHDNTVLGGNFRVSVLKKLGLKTVPCVRLNIQDENRARELALRLNKNTGDWNLELLAEFDPALLADVGFDSEELDDIFSDVADNPEQFDLKKELEKLDIKTVEAQKGDVYKLGDSRLMVGDSTVEADILKLMNGERADMCFTDPPYRLSYLRGGIRHGKPTEGFGAKRNRKYLETDELPEDFTELWMGNIAQVAKPDFSIIVYEAWHNIREIWNEMEKYWRVRNMIIWHLPNRHQGFAAKYKFFSKYDAAMVGAGGMVAYNFDPEEAPLQQEYETALYATAGKPTWEGYDKGKRYQPTDFIDYQASDEKSSGQGVIFGTKPIEILIPYIKVLTRRGDLVVEPFCGSGSTLIAATKLNRRCYIMEKSPVYAEVALKRWEKLTGLKREKLS